MDEPGWSFRDADGNQRWHVERLRDVLAAEPAGHLFVSGCAEDQVGFYPSFDHVVLLSAPRA